MSTTILPGTLDATLYVEIAWGADLTAAPASWGWTDVTADVRHDDGIEIRAGRGDEASATAPASCRFRVDNATSAYSLGGRSPNWPNVRLNVPVRVRATVSAQTFTLFQGGADSFTPSWPPGGADAVVTVSASGALRRLMQGDSPVLSSIRRAMTDLSSVVAYWPCEDGRDAAFLASGLTDRPMPMTFAGSPSLAADDAFECSSDLPTLRGASLTGAVTAYTVTGEQQVRLLASFPPTGLVDATVLRVMTTGGMRQWDLRVRGSDGALELIAYDSLGVSVLDTAWVTFAVLGTRVRLSLELSQSGGDVVWRIGTYSPRASFASYYETGSPLAGRTVGVVSQVSVNPDGLLDDVAVGHVTVQDATTSQFDVSAQVDANAGETATDRISRLCAENDIPVTVVGTSDVAMGPQPVASLLDALRGAETADQGVLHDGGGPGLTYTARATRENAAASLTVAAASGETPDLAPVHDDQGIRNVVTASRPRGTAYRHADETGPLGTAVVGAYDTSVTVDIDDDTLVRHYAGWLVHRGTVEGYRYPSLGLALHHDPGLAVAWLGCGLGERVDVTGLSTVRTQHPIGTVSVAVEGHSQRIDRFRWDVVANCSSQRPWRVVVLATASGDTGEHLCRLGTDGSTLVSGVSAGATSLSVATASGPLWTRAADDVPFAVTVGGVPVTVTAVSGTTSPQTFTVTAVTTALSAADPIVVADPTVLSL